MKKYPSIEQFRSVIREVKSIHDYKGKDEEGKAIYQHTENYPILKFIGTVKLHGTNAGIVKYKDRLEFQSRERVLTLNQDNAGFMTYMVDKDLNNLFSIFEFNESVVIYGEWCGGNIQKGVALNGLPKMFVVFGVKVDDEWVDLPTDLHLNEISIYNILQFKTFEIDIDFNKPEEVQNTLIDLTINVENTCPVGKYFGKEGIGEGIVFTCESNHNLKFKSKGEKHSSSKVKVLNSVDTEELKSINEFVDYAVTENRLNQGLQYFKENGIEIESKNTGQFLAWIVKDVLKEESDTLVNTNLSDKKIKNAIVNRSRVWFLNAL
jgi:hypothetical protein